MSSRPEREARARELRAEGKSFRDIAAATGLTRFQVKLACGADPNGSRKRMPDSGITVEPRGAPVSTDEYLDGGRTWKGTRLLEERPCTEAELLAAFGADPDRWAVKQWKIGAWNMGAKDASSVLQIKTLYKSEAILTLKVDVIDARKEILALLEEARRDAPAMPLLLPAVATGKLLEVSVFDAHFGKLGWGIETGDRNYDLAEARGRYLECVEDIIRRAGHGIERILFPVGNDLLNSEANGMTTAGTPQPGDGRYPKVFRTVYSTQIEAIKLLRQVAPVDVVMVGGNHDRYGIFHLGEMLGLAFANDPAVMVDNSLTPQKFYRWGLCMVMFTHGSDEKRKDIPGLMASTQPRMWGDTVYREVHLGHLHQTRVEEFNGVRVRILPSICSTDEWHRRMGYYANLQGAEAFLWDKRRGLMGTTLFTVEPVVPDEWGRLVA